MRRLSGTCGGSDVRRDTAKQFQSPPRTAHAISTLVLNGTRAMKIKRGIAMHGWIKPKEDFVKLNVDASFSSESGTGSTGAIIRDDRGHFFG